MARSRSLLSALLLGVFAAAGHAQNTTTTATTAGAPATTAAAASDAPCATGLHLIVARGSSEQPGEGRIGVVAGNVTERVPGSTVEAVEYPATLTDYLESEGDGVAAMAALIAAYVGRCPDSRIALLGYSQVSKRRGSRSWGDWLAAGLGRSRTRMTRWCGADSV